MMKLLFLILKDLRVLKRNPKTVILLLVGPAVMMLIIGLIFSASASPELAQLSVINVGVCDNDQSELSKNFTSFIGENFNTLNTTQGEQCEAKMKRDLEEGRLMAVVSIPEGFQKGIEEGQSKKVDINVSNAKPQLAVILKSSLEGYVSRLSKELSVEFVSVTWTNLQKMSSDLKSLSGNLNESKQDFSNLRYKLDRTTQDLDEIDTDEMQIKLHEAQSDVQKNKEAREEYTQEIEFYINQIDQLRLELDQTSDILEETDRDLVQTRNDLIQTRQNLQETYDDAECEEADNPPYTGNWTVDEYINRWVTMCNNIEVAISDINQLIIDVDIQRGNIDAMQVEINDARNTLSNIRSELVSLRYELEDTSDINRMEQNLDEMEDTVEELSRTKQTAQRNLGNAKNLLSEAVDGIGKLQTNASNTGSVLDNLTGRASQNVVTPVSSETSFLYGEFRNIDAFFPAILSIVVMFISVLFAAVTVIREKESGTMKRLKMSPVLTVWIVLSKVFVTLLMVSVQIIMLFFMAGVFFQVKMNYIMILPAFLVAGLLAVTAAAIGMIIASFSKTENTAILASLVICIPLMFLTGVFFPWELMLPVMRIASLLSPLTSAVNVLNSLLIYSWRGFDWVGVVLSSSYLMLWSVLSIIFSTILLRNNKP